MIVIVDTHFSADDGKPTIYDVTCRKKKTVSELMICSCPMTLIAGGGISTSFWCKTCYVYRNYPYDVMVV